MSLDPGSKLEHYEILSSLGAGGMGEVYRARDTKLGREVAIKLLLEEVSSDPDRLARFDREARVLASLNHPNIASLYAFEREGDTSFLVMELVEGETLADRLARGPMPVREAIPVFAKIAEALEAAHDSGVVHRDLKPANIKVGGDGDASGGVKILDFGLAKAMTPEATESGDASQSMSPTLTLAATQRGEILGTAAYMSPEQARGKVIDKRTDVWAFGVCLYEALVGGRPFQGEDAMDTIGGVLRDAPDLDALPDEVPWRLRELLERCLRKDPRRRLRDIGDALIELETTSEGPGPESAVNAAEGRIGRSRALFVGLAIGAVAAIIAGVTAWSLKPAPPIPPLRAVVSGPPNAEVSTGISQIDLAISPTGDRIVYWVEENDSDLYIRSLDRLEGEQLGGMPFAFGPFFSPDGSWVGFIDGSRTGLRKISSSGGSPIAICDLPPPAFARGASWGEDDNIIFAATGSQGLLRVPATGGNPESLTSPASGEEHVWPHILPGGKAVLFTVARDDNFDIALLLLDTGEMRTLLAGGSAPRYVPTGHLVYGLDQALRAVPFDLDRMEITGDPVPVLEGVVTKASGAVNFDISQGGRLAYVAGHAIEGTLRSLVWVDREGREEAIDAAPASFEHPRLSPSGETLALGLLDQEIDIWTLDLSTGTLSRLTFGHQPDRAPVWTPGGERILFASRRGEGGAGGIYSKAASGAGTADLLMQDADAFPMPLSISPDGSQLVYALLEGFDDDLHALSLDGQPQAQALLETEFREGQGEISPDGRWIAYRSDESGVPQVYVRPFPNVDDGRWQISTTAGFHPVWSRDGRELFYRNTSGELWAAPVETGQEFRHRAPQLLFQGAYYFQHPIRTYDVSADGQRFVMLKAHESNDDGTQPKVVLVENWFEELERIVPTD